MTTIEAIVFIIGVTGFAYFGLNFALYKIVQKKREKVLGVPLEYYKLDKKWWQKW